LVGAWYTGPAGDAQDVLRAVARYARVTFGWSSVGFDSAAKDFTALNDSTTVKHHPEKETKLLAEDLGGTVISFPRGLCSTSKASGCLRVAGG
jgi:hypothetical protein